MIELVILHDSASGVTVAQDLNGKELARITLPSTRSRRCSGIQTMNHGEGLRVESLRSSRWPEDNKSEIVRNESIAKAISDQVSNQANPSDPSVKLETNDGSRLTGIFRASNTSDSSISFIANSIPQPILIAIEKIHRISQNQTLARSETTDIGSFRMSTNLVTLDVELKPFRRSNDLEIMTVDSVHFEKPAIVSVGASGNIKDVMHYKKLAEAKSKLLSKSIQARSPGAAGNPSTDFRIPSAIVLRTGETLHAELMSIDEAGIHFSSKLTDSSLLKIDEVRSMFLHPRMHPLPIDRDKMERLMTVPRNQADNAPQSLLITTAGDYLRGTVIRLDDTTLDFLVKDKTLRIPRRSISGIVWPHEATKDQESTDQATEDTDEPAALQRPLNETSNQVSIEFIAENSVDPGLMTMTIDAVENNAVENSAAEKNFVRGRNLLLGDVELPLKKITDISFGDIFKKTNDQPSNPWVFTIAKAPTTWEQDGTGDNSPGTLGDSSPLVGVQAPPFRLNDLAGDAIRLDQYRGKVVVLDFWASWCGPCMESLPEVYRIANSFGSDRCQWLGINLQESQDQAAKIASRLGIENTILLDSDGKVASLYDASAIPLVIVIAPDGIVQRVFIGMESSRRESLRSAIEACLKE
jgi:peroxiredoxin